MSWVLLTRQNLFDFAQRFEPVAPRCKGKHFLLYSQPSLYMVTKYVRKGCGKACQVCRRSLTIVQQRVVITVRLSVPSDQCAQCLHEVLYNHLDSRCIILRSCPTILILVLENVKVFACHLMKPNTLSLYYIKLFETNKKYQQSPTSHK